MEKTKQRTKQLEAIRSKFSDLLECLGNAAGLLRETATDFDAECSDTALMCADDAQCCLTEAEQVLSSMQVELAKWQGGAS